MNFVSNMLAASGWKGIFEGTDYNFLGDVFDAVAIGMWILLGLVGAAGAIYAIYLGIQLARADEQGKRDDAKKHLITVLIAVAVTLVLILFFNLLLPVIVEALIDKPDFGTGGEESITAIVNVAHTALRF